MTEYRVTGARVLVRPRQSAASDTVALTDHQPITSGFIVAKGTTCRESYAVGDCVCFTAFVGDEATIDGRDYLILDERDLLAVVVPRQLVAAAPLANLVEATV